MNKKKLNKLNDLIQNQCIEFFKKMNPINEKRKQKWLEKRTLDSMEFYNLLPYEDLYTISMASVLCSIIKIHLEKTLTEESRFFQINKFCIEGDMVSLEFLHSTEQTATLEQRLYVVKDYEYSILGNH